MTEEIYIDTVNVSFMTRGGMLNRTFTECSSPYRFIGKALKNNLVVSPDTLDIEVTYTWEDGKQLTLFAGGDLGMSEHCSDTDGLGMQELLEIWAGSGKHHDKYAITASKTAGEKALQYYDMIASRHYEGLNHLEEDYGDAAYASAVNQQKYVSLTVKESKLRLNHMLNKPVSERGKFSYAGMRQMGISSLKSASRNSLSIHGLGENPLALTCKDEVIAVMLTPEAYESLIAVKGDKK